MSNITLKDTTTLGALFDEASAWENLPTSALSEDQLALIQLKKAVFSKPVISKNGGAAVAIAKCFICVTGL